MPLWRLDHVDIDLSPSPLPIDRTNSPGIATHWTGASAANPALYDGPVLLVGAWSVTDGTLRATCHRSTFRSVLWLRANWRPELSAWNAFGSGLLRTSDGAILLGEMAADTANPGRIYCPGGILDEDDVSGAHVHPECCIRRELAEETGLGPGDYRMAPGWLVAQDGRALSLARLCQLDLTAEVARERILARIASQAQPELAGIHIVRTLGDADRLQVPGFTRMKIAALFDA